MMKRRPDLLERGFIILDTIAEKLKRPSKDDFKRRQFEAWLIIQAVSWYLRYPLSDRDLQEMFRERGFEVDHSSINRWVLAYAPMIEEGLLHPDPVHCVAKHLQQGIESDHFRVKKNMPKIGWFRSFNTA